jgi:hypothetical protein
VADTTDAPLDASGAVVAFSSAPVVPASSSAGKSGASRDAFVARPSAGPSGAPGELRFTGAAQFRARLVLATLARRPLRIDRIGGDDGDALLFGFLARAQLCEQQCVRRADRAGHGKSFAGTQRGQVHWGNSRMGAEL